MQSPLISIIVPVFNMAKFLNKCIDSILKQSYYNLEIIIIDDCSTDNSSEIIKNYLCCDERIKTIRHDENKGHYQTCITGMSAAAGEYFIFICGDECISVDLIRLLVKKAIETNSDITAAPLIYDNTPSDTKEKTESGLHHEVEKVKYVYRNLERMHIIETSSVDNNVENFIKQCGVDLSVYKLSGKLFKHILLDKSIAELAKFSEDNKNINEGYDISFYTVFILNSKVVSNIRNEHCICRNDKIINADVKTISKGIYDISLCLEHMRIQLRNYGIYEKYSKYYIQWKSNYANMIFDDLKSSGIKLKKYENIIRKSFDYNDDFVGQIAKNSLFHNIETIIDDKDLYVSDIKNTITDELTQYVSFDIFDTVILRPFLKPSDMFSLLNLKFRELFTPKSHVDFAQIRIDAECSCRQHNCVLKRSSEDVTLNEIYAFISENYMFDGILVEQLKAYEIELELKFCYSRNLGKELYELAIHCGKKVIFVSDMYLPKDVIESILKKNGYNEYENLYLSSELQYTKHTGSMYKHVLHDLKIQNKNVIIHIGDNIHADCKNAKKAGIKSFHLPNCADMYRNIVPDIWSGDSLNRITQYNHLIDISNSMWGFLGFRSVIGMCANKIFDRMSHSINTTSDYDANPYFIGYATLGPHILALLNWFTNDTEFRKADTIHFVARDGFLLKKAYDILCKIKPDLPKSNYLYISRKSLALVDIYSKADFYSLINKLNIFNYSPKKLTIMFKSVLCDNVTSDEVEKYIQKNNISWSRKFINKVDYERGLMIIVDNFIDFNKLEENRIKLRKYFGEIIHKNDLLFDVGYSGRAESALTQLLGYAVNSRYIHTNSSVPYLRQAQYDFKTKCFYEFKPSVTGVMREHMMMEQGPSTIGYKESGGLLSPLFEEYECDYTSNYVTEIVQDAAIEFIKDYYKFFTEFETEMIFRNTDLAMFFEYYQHYAKPIDREIFSSLTFEDDFGEGADVSAVDYWNKQSRRYLDMDGFVIGEQGLQRLPDALADIYADGLFVKFYKKLNRIMPKGSKRREFVKKAVKIFFK